MEYFKPDDTWEVLGINSREEFVNTFVVVGKFHEDVPDDIVKSFKTVTYLLAHSYYYYPLLDEALSKALLIMEMAVKLKAKQLRIDLKRPPNKKGITYDKKLAEIIKEVCSQPYLSFLKLEFERARGLRNQKMHPVKHSFMGIASRANSNAHLFINIINLLFSSQHELEQINIKNKTLKEELSIFKNGLFVLEYNETKILIVDIHSSKYVKGNRSGLFLLYVNPIFNNVDKIFIQKQYPDPLVLAFKSFNINNSILEAIDSNDSPVRIYTTDKPENLSRWYLYSEELKKVEAADLNLYMNMNGNRVLWQMEALIYNNCWEDTHLISVK